MRLVNNIVALSQFIERADFFGVFVLCAVLSCVRLYMTVRYKHKFGGRYLNAARKSAGKDCHARRHKIIGFRETAVYAFFGKLKTKHLSRAFLARQNYRRPVHIEHIGNILKQHVYITAPGGRAAEVEVYYILRRNFIRCAGEILKYYRRLRKGEKLRFVKPQLRRPAAEKALFKKVLGIGGLLDFH